MSLAGVSRGWRCGVTGRREGEGWERAGQGRFDAVIDISQGKGEEHWSRVTCNPLDQIAIDNLGNFPRLVSLDFTASEMRVQTYTVILGIFGTSPLK